MEQTRKCPYCDFPSCRADWVDIGVGLEQCGPFSCPACGAFEIGTYDNPSRLSENEEKYGWYGPGSDKCKSSGNVISGEFVAHNVMREEYRAEFHNNPMWFDKDYVKEWWESIRRKRQ